MSELDRREFLKIVGLSAGAAAAAGCSDPTESLIPYVIQPETITPGISVDYASTCMECSAGCGLHVKTREGRPIKLEGSPEHPINRGRLCARGQAGLGRTYHPDRIAGPATRNSDDSLQPISWADAQAKLAATLGQSAGRTWILGGPVGPSLDGLVDRVVAATGIAGRLTYEPFADHALLEAGRELFGVYAQPIFDLSGTDLVVDFGSDFLDTGRSPVEHARQLAESRDLASHPDGGARVVYVGPRQTLTGSNADLWLAVRPGSEGVLALALAQAVAQVKGNGFVASAASSASKSAAIEAAGIDAARFDELAGRLAAARRAVALPPFVAAATTAAKSDAAAVMLLNAAIGAIGSAVKFPAVDAKRTATLTDVKALVERMQAGQVDCLLIHDLNPVYALSASLGFADALSKVGLVVAFAPLADETTEKADLLLPDHTPMESWGDASPRPGVRSLVQPTIRPLFDTQALGDTLLSAARAVGGAVAAALPAGSWKSVLESNWSGTSWRQALARGGEFGDTPMREGVFVEGFSSVSTRAPSLAGSGAFTLIAFPHSFLGDGRGAALPWMQEIPDPVTKLSWNSWVELSHAKAAELGVTMGDVVTVATDAGSVDVSVFPRGGIPDDVIAIPIGQGHTVGHYASMAGARQPQPGVARGINVLDLLPVATDAAGGQAFLATKATVSKTGRYRRIALSQWTDNQRKRGLAPEVSLYDLASSGGQESGGMAHFLAAAPAAASEHEGEHGGEGGHGEGGDHAAGGHHFEGPPFEYEAAYDADPNQPYRWGMTIDNDKCTGCSACIAACYIENNVSIVGEEQALMHREMTWLRIERYVGDGDDDGSVDSERRPIPSGERLGENKVRHLPMLCQHCGAAPCEAVCPVIATYHTPEGINGMVYNRCVGTRYCANNCTYKVRRFNYFDYGRLNWPGLLGLMLNPDVTVRGQGVMEKCTFCVQRIEAARQPAKDAKQPIAANAVKTACQQSCPSDAISFGNVRDAASDAVKRAAAAKPRAYAALQVLNTRSAVTYLAQVRREES